MDGGWIKLLRKFTRWGWYDDPPTKDVFLHLLLTANHQDKEWRGEIVRRGQVVTGRKKLAKETGLSEQQVRTALKKLHQTGEISTIKTTNRYTILSIEKYDSYQDGCEIANQQSNQQATNKQPTSNQQATTNKNEKNEENEENNNTPHTPQGGDDKKASKKKSKEKKAIEYTEPFLRFWDAYPKKVGKGAAAKSWNDKIENPDQTVHQILDALEWQKRSHDWTRDEGRYIPYPSTYLNQRRWEDEPPEVSKVDTGEKLPAWMKELYGETTGK